MAHANNDDPLILHVRGVTGFGGGPEKTILNSPRFLQNLGYRCECAYMHPPFDKGIQQLMKRAAVANAELVSVHDRGAWDWRVLTRLIGYCRQKRVAIWHGHDYKSNLFGLVARRFWPMKLVTTLHGWVEHTRRTPLYYAIDRRCLPYYDEVICVSDDLYQSALKFGVLPNRCRLIHNAIDTEDFRRAASNATDSATATGPIVLGAMGRLSHEKGFDLLVRAIAELNAEGTQCHLRIAGEGPQRNDLMQLIVDLKIDSSIKLLGQVNDVKSFFETSDAFVLSSRREGLPNVLLEAMAMQVPVVATRIAGIPRLIDSGVNGILIEPESVDELKQGIRQLTKNRELCRQLAAAGRQTIEQSFSFQKRMERVAAIYDHLLGRTKRTSLGTMVEAL
ncbi:MAG: glycosyltransferase [Pirellula staleyi]